MSRNLLEKLVKSEPVTDNDLANELHDVCDEEHSSCSNYCPVFKANGGKAPKDRSHLSKHCGCACFKNGGKMLAFLRKAHAEMRW
jgi:hypothetical protein